MMQPTDARNRDDVSELLGFDRSLVWGILLQPKMGSICVVVVDVSADHSSNLTLIDCDHVVKAVSS